MLGSGLGLGCPQSSFGTALGTGARAGALPWAPLSVQQMIPTSREIMLRAITPSAAHTYQRRGDGASGGGSAVALYCGVLLQPTRAYSASFSTVRGPEYRCMWLPLSARSSSSG